MKVSKKIENELWMMVELNDKPSIIEKKKDLNKKKTNVIDGIRKYVDPKKIN